jgi:hypothetical protein
MVKGVSEETSSFLDIIESEGNKYREILLSGEEFSSCINTSISTGLHIMEKRFLNVKYVFVERENVDRFTSSIVHIISENLESILKYRSFHRYIKDLYIYSARQREFFREKGALFLSFSELASRGIGSAFLDVVSDVRIEEIDKPANAGGIYSSKISLLPEAEKKKICTFISGDVSANPEILDQEGVAEFIRRHVASFLTDNDLSVFP